VGRHEPNEDRALLDLGRFVRCDRIDPEDDVRVAPRGFRLGTGDDLGACIAVMLIGEVGVLARAAFYDDIEAFFDVALRRFRRASDPSLAFDDFLGHENLRHPFLLRGRRQSSKPD
jgi:hypothetical protein